MVKRKSPLLLGTCIVVLLIVLIGPADIFVHGFFYEVADYGRIEKEDFGRIIRLGHEDYEMKFMPADRHFAGFLINLLRQPEDNTGFLVLTILDRGGNEVDRINIDLSKVVEKEWYKVYTDEALKKGEEYTLRIHAKDCRQYPCLQTIDSDYLPDESRSGNLLIGYAYADSTFTFQEKVLIILFIIVIWSSVCTAVCKGEKKEIRYFLAGIFMVILLSWNYMYNSMNNQNTLFENYQADSETLVTNVIVAEQNEIYYQEEDEKGYGLGHYYDVKGVLMSNTREFLSDDNWEKGYSRTVPAFIVNSNIYTKSVSVIGNYIQFENGDIYRIKDISDDDVNIIIYLDSDKILNPDKYGDLGKLVFYDSAINQLDSGFLSAYKSQYGLQGKIFRHMARHIDRDEVVASLNLICCLAAAVIFVMIVFLIFEKYNLIMAGIFFIVFWLSPWITNFARNLYWVEFTWFIPILAGLFCAWKVYDKKCRIISYIVVFIAFVGKSLCGYEYMSVIMLGMISFLLVDLVKAFVAKNRTEIVLLLRTIFILGIIALVGFITAMYVHAILRGNGDAMEGMKEIFEQDVLRRTNGADLNMFSEELWESFNASAWETYSKYFHFSTEIIVGIPGNLFPMLCMVPLCIFGYDFYKKQLNIELLSMYVISFLTSISWFYLAKSHSYVHTHMNYVLWYFGYIQVCLYVIVNKFAEVFFIHKNRRY